MTSGKGMGNALKSELRKIIVKKDGEVTCILKEK